MRLSCYYSRMDKKKTERLYKANYRRLFLVARSILMDDEESRDAVNEAFSRLLSATVGDGFIRPNIAEGDEVGFLTVCVRNICLNTLKRKNIRERFAKMCFSTERAYIGDETYWKDKAAEVMSVVDSHFTERMKQVFRLRFVEGLKYDEIATELGVARMTVYNDLLRIIDLIKEKVEMP